MYSNRSIINPYNHSVMLEIIHKIMPIIYVVYFGINLFVVGWSLYRDGHMGRFSIFDTVIFLLFGLPIVLSLFIWDNLLTPLFKILQIKFFWQFYFTDKWKKCSISVLQNLNRFMYNPTVAKKTLKNRIYKHVLNMVFKRNNYKPVEHKTAPEWLETMHKDSRVKVISPDGWINDRDFQNTRITKIQFIQNMKASIVKHAITFDINRF